jgi:hypothetical protein
MKSITSPYLVLSFAATAPVLEDSFLHLPRDEALREILLELIAGESVAPEGQKKENKLDAPEKSHPHWMEHYSAFPAQARLHDLASKMHGSCFFRIRNAASSFSNVCSQLRYRPVLRYRHPMCSGGSSDAN